MDCGFCAKLQEIRRRERGELLNGRGRGSLFDGSYSLVCWHAGEKINDTHKICICLLSNCNSAVLFKLLEILTHNRFISILSFDTVSKNLKLLLFLINFLKQRYSIKLFPFWVRKRVLVYHFFFHPRGWLISLCLSPRSLFRPPSWYFHGHLI